MPTILFCGREVTAEALGRSWTFSRWTLTILDDFLTWARTQIPDPLDLATRHVEKMMVEEEKISNKALLAHRNKIKDELVTGAIKQAASYLDFGSPQVQSLLHSPLGGSHLLMLLLKAHQPDVTEEDAFQIIQEIGDQKLQHIMDVTTGKVAPSLGNGQAPVASS